MFSGLGVLFAKFEMVRLTFKMDFMHSSVVIRPYHVVTKAKLIDFFFRIVKHVYYAYKSPYCIIKPKFYVQIIFISNSIKYSRQYKLKLVCIKHGLKKGFYRLTVLIVQYMYTKELEINRSIRLYTQTPTTNMFK